MKCLILKKNLIKEWEILKSSHVVEDKDETSKLQEENFSLLYTPYEDISSNKFENEIEKPPPNIQEDIILVIDDETSQENLQQEELEEENNCENKEDSHCIEEEHCQDIANETIILNVEKEEKENVFKKEISHLIEYRSTMGQPRLDYIEYWFKSIVNPPMQTSLVHTLLNPIVVHFGHAPDFHAPELLAETPIFLLLLEPISQVNRMLEWLHWKSSYT
jgi:hypothetical protein